MARLFRHSPPAAGAGGSRTGRILLTWLGLVAVAAGFVSMFLELSRPWQIVLVVAGLSVGYLLLIGYRDQHTSDMHDFPAD